MIFIFFVPSDLHLSLAFAPASFAFANLSLLKTPFNEITEGPAKRISPRYVVCDKFPIAPRCAYSFPLLPLICAIPFTPLQLCLYLNSFIPTWFRQLASGFSAYVGWHDI